MTVITEEIQSLIWMQQKFEAIVALKMNKREIFALKSSAKNLVTSSKMRFRNKVKFLVKVF